MNVEVAVNHQDPYNRHNSFTVKKITFNESGQITVSGQTQDGTYKNAVRVKIEGIYLHKFPRGIGLVFPVVQELFINNCALKKISREDFADMKNLKTLDLSNNKIFQVPVDAFLDLSSLKLLSLASNLVMFIDIRMFANLDSLERFELNSEKHTDINYNTSRVFMMRKIVEFYKPAPEIAASTFASTLESYQQKMLALEQKVNELQRQLKSQNLEC